MCRLAGRRGRVHGLGTEERELDGKGLEDERGVDEIGQPATQEGAQAAGRVLPEEAHNEDGGHEVGAGDCWASSTTPGRAEFRCEDCRFAVLCRHCVVREHLMTPFHRVEVRSSSNARFWERVQCKSDIGIVVQLVHEVGDSCFRPHAVKNFSVIHTNGIHRMTVNFCRCQLGVHLSDHTQLMRARLWPATFDEPETATTFEAMDDFNRLSMLGRLSAYDYYKAARACTDAVGLLKVSPLLKQFTRGAHQFRHIFLFKRAGRAYEGGIYSSPPGSCGIECPGCAREGVNVPEDYMDQPDSWTQDRAICVDANFRLGNKMNRSTDKTDPSLTEGRAYVVSSGEFKAFCDAMDKNKTKEKPSDCSRFGAMEFANQKGGRYMRSTRVAGVFCARHDMILPLAMGQLKVGERYSVIDFCVANAFRYISVDKVVLSYDIACQWSKNVVKRMKAVDPKFEGMYDGAQTFLGKTLEYVVPKFHLFAHKVKCWFGQFNLAFLPGAGQMDGEGCERFWSGANPAAGSVREMGPGSIRDFFDSMWDSWNFQKVCGMGSSTPSSSAVLCP
ncbi:hypothetical protein PENSPDRAFT_570640 [Peniophora sp. CONT]|nr:hypothetical protein PENSPDRAFT_570640 [Peniophora sp. CONT]